MKLMLQVIPTVPLWVVRPTTWRKMISIIMTVIIVNSMMLLLPITTTNAFVIQVPVKYINQQQHLYLQSQIPPTRQKQVSTSIFQTSSSSYTTIVNTNNNTSFVIDTSTSTSINEPILVDESNTCSIDTTNMVEQPINVNYNEFLQKYYSRHQNEQNQQQQSPTDLLESVKSVYESLERLAIWNTYLIQNKIRISYVTPPLYHTNNTKQSKQSVYSTWDNQRIQSLVNYSYLPIELQPTAIYNYENSLHSNDSDNDVAIDTGTSNEKPIALFIPGLDGYGVSACTYQYQDLSTTFELYRLLLQDRFDTSISFVQLINVITTFVQKLITLNPHRKVIVIGESMGGLIASAVAIQLQSKLQQVSNTQQLQLGGLVLVNPATSFQQTSLDLLVPLLTSLQNHNTASTGAEATATVSPYAVFGSLFLSTVIPDQSQTQRLIQTIIDSTIASINNTESTAFDISTIVTQTIPNTITTISNLLLVTENLLPPQTIYHRTMNWLSPGSIFVNENLYKISTNQVQVPALIVVGEQDALLPSANEPQRLLNIGVTNLDTLRVRDRGHFVLDDSVNLTEAIVYSRTIDPFYKYSVPIKNDGNIIIKKKKLYNPITDWTPPSNLQQFIQTSIKPFRDVFSPIFISTDSTTGKRWFGVGKLPSRVKPNESSSSKKNPILFVGNHQLLALDMQLFISELWQQRGIYVRGLAHPVAFQSFGGRNSNTNTTTKRPFDNDLRGRTPGLVVPVDATTSSTTTTTPTTSMSSFENFGAVQVSPRNYYKLLQTGQCILLFPGGVQEAQSGDRSYPLYWPNNTDFVRTAAKFNATIIPFSAIGMPDSFNVPIERTTLLRTPFIGDFIRQQSSNTTRARFDSKPDDDDMLLFPLALPSIPQRNYFLLGQPIDTTTINPNNKEECLQVYQMTKNQVRTGLDDLLYARTKDPFQDTIRRIAYEHFFQKQAPTFSIDVLNEKRQRRRD